MDDSDIFDLPGAKFILLSEDRITFPHLLDCGAVDTCDRDPWDNGTLSEGGQARTELDSCKSSTFEGLLASL